MADEKHKDDKKDDDHGKPDTTPIVVGDSVELKAELIVTAVLANGDVTVFAKEKLGFVTLPAITFRKKHKD